MAGGEGEEVAGGVLLPSLVLRTPPPLALPPPPPPSIPTHPLPLFGPPEAAPPAVRLLLSTPLRLLVLLTPLPSAVTMENPAAVVGEGVWEGEGVASNNRARVEALDEARDARARQYAAVLAASAA